MTVEEMKQDLIQQFVQRRKEQGLTQEQLEERSEVSLLFIIKFRIRGNRLRIYEKKTENSIEICLKIENIFGSSLKNSIF